MSLVISKHILLVGNTSWGMYNFRKDLIKFLLNKGFEITVIAPKDNIFSLKLQELGCSFIKININGKGINLFDNIKIIYYLYMNYKRLRPNLIFHYTIKPVIYGSIAARLLDIPQISIITGLGYSFLNKSFVTKIVIFLYKISLVSAKEVWFLNHDDKTLFINKKILQPHLCGILNGEGINLEEFKPIEINTNKKSFILIARLLWDKGVLEYVKASKILKQKYPDISFNLLGYLSVNNPSAIDENIVSEWHRQRIICYLGSTDDVSSYISQSTCIVLPSYREGLSRILMESAAMEKPIIATNIPGCKEIVEDGITGFLCEVKNINSLVEKMEVIISLSKYQLSLMGKKGREKMKREFDQEIINSKYLTAINTHLD